MPVKSIIEIEVQDDAFKAFAELFKKYQDSLNKMPGAWKEAEKAADGVSDASASTNSKITATINFISKQTQEQQKMRREVERTNNSMTDLGRSTLRVAAGIKDITFSMLKWGTLTGVFSTLTGAGGLFGYTALASSTAGTRRSALELGVTPGQLQAANITYERIGGAGNILERIAEIKEDVTRRYLLEQLGISPQDIEDKSAADLLPQVVEGLRSRYLSISPELRSTLSPSFGLTQFGLGLPGLRLLGGTPEEELRGLGEQYRQRSTQLGAADETGRAFADFLASLQSAGTALQTTLADRLVQLSGPINNLVDAFTNLIRTGINTPAFESGIRSFAEYIQQFATWIGSEEGRDNLRKFAENIASVVAGLGRMVAWLASWFPERNEGQNAPSAPPGRLPLPGGERFLEPYMRRGEPASYTLTSGQVAPITGDYGVRPITGGSGVRPITGGPGIWGEHFASLENRHGLPGGLLNSIYQLESGGGRNMGPSRSGALGPFQFMPRTAEWLGLQDPMDTSSSANAAARFMEYLLNRFSGDLEMAAASYNWGEGNVRRQVRLLGPRWREGLPEETRNYINRLMTGLGPNTGMLNAQSGQQVSITFYNSTGSNVITSLTGLGVAA